MSLCVPYHFNISSRQRHLPHTGTHASLDLRYYVKATSDCWLDCESMCAISFQQLILPEKHLPHTSTSFLDFPTPLSASHDLQYYVKVISYHWIRGCESMCDILFQYLILPVKHLPHTGRHILCLCVLGNFSCFLSAFFSELPKHMLKLMGKKKILTFLCSKNLFI